MSFKLIGMIILLVIVTVFCGFNNGAAYRCSVNLLFRTFSDVPVFLTVLVSFLAGAVVALPFTFGRRAKKQPKEPLPEKPAKAKKARWGKRGFTSKSAATGASVAAGAAFSSAPRADAETTGFNGAASAYGVQGAGGADAYDAENATAASDGFGLQTAAVPRPAAQPPLSPLKAALANAKLRKAQKKAVKAKASAAKKADGGQTAPSPNDVPKVY